MKTAKTEKCWICDGQGESGEHLLKASDIKLYFPNITQKKPVYYHDRYKNNVLLGSRRSKQLHSNAKLCMKCNNQISQPYDMAWKKLSEYLYKNSTLIKKRKYFDLKDVFDNDFQTQAQNIQLYFVKLLGCLFWDIPEKIRICNSFSKSILQGCSSDYVFLEFSINEDGDMGVTDLFIDEACIKGMIFVKAEWMYYLPRIKIKIYYSLSKNNTFGWHPRDSKKIKLVKS